MAFTSGVREFFATRDEPAAGTKAHHLLDWLTALDAAMKVGMEDKKHRDHAKKLFNHLRGAFNTTLLARSDRGACVADVVGTYCDKALLIKLGQFHDIKEFLEKMLPPDLADIKVAHLDGGVSGNPVNDGCAVVIGQELMPLPATPASRDHSASKKGKRKELHGIQGPALRCLL
jgi:hypothetical protein